MVFMNLFLAVIIQLFERRMKHQQKKKAAVPGGGGLLARMRKAGAACNMSPHATKSDCSCRSSQPEKFNPCHLASVAAGRSFINKSGNQSNTMLAAIGGAVSRIFSSRSGAASLARPQVPSSATGKGSGLDEGSEGGAASVRFVGRVLPQAIGEGVEKEACQTIGAAALPPARQKRQQPDSVISARLHILRYIQQRRRPLPPAVSDAEACAVAASAAAGGPIGPESVFSDAVTPGRGLSRFPTWSWTPRTRTALLQDGQFPGASLSECEDEFSWQELFETLRAVSAATGRLPAGPMAEGREAGVASTLQLTPEAAAMLERAMTGGSSSDSGGLLMLKSGMRGYNLPPLPGTVAAPAYVTSDGALLAARTGDISLGGGTLMATNMQAVRLLAQMDCQVRALGSLAACKHAACQPRDCIFHALLPFAGARERAWVPPFHVPAGVPGRGA